MRPLTMSHQHANLEALTRVRESVDAVVVLGDIVDDGPDPAETVAWVRRNAIWVVRDNHDLAVATGASTGASPAWLDRAAWDDGDVRLRHRRYEIGPLLARLAWCPVSLGGRARLVRSRERGEIGASAAPGLDAPEVLDG